MSTFDEPLKETEPETSPESEIVLAVCNVEAVEAFPVSGEVTFAKVTDEDVSTS